MVAARLGRQPYFMQGLLQIDNDLGPVGKGHRDHAAHPLVIDVGIGFVIDAIATGLNARQKVLSGVQKFKVGHYNP
jgi:hypothetical protein